VKRLSDYATAANPQRLAIFETLSSSGQLCLSTGMAASVWSESPKELGISRHKGSVSACCFTHSGKLASASFREGITVVADQFPPGDEVCRVEDNMDYHRVKIGNGDFLLPEAATMDVLFSEGIESVNEISYSDCHEYAGRATIRFDDDAVAIGAPKSEGPQPAAPARQLPPGLRFRIGLASPLRSETAAAGDAVTGVILHEVKDRKLGLIARENDVVHGRILQLEQHMYPFQRWLLAIRFDTLEHDGAEQPLALKPRERGGTFVFAQVGDVVIDQSFHSEWETR
jgi:hypothetical protein